jgi:hypothetical protein
MMTPYPGKLIDDETGFRILKCYIYKFIKNNISKRPKFNLQTKQFTEKEYFWFNTLRPLYGNYHNIINTERLQNILKAQFISNEEKIYFMPQYYQEEHKTKRKSYVYCCTGEEVKQYLTKMHTKDLQNITLTSSTFNWAVDIFEDLVASPANDMDVLIYVHRPKTKT